MFQDKTNQPPKIKVINPQKQIGEKDCGAFAIVVTDALYCRFTLAGSRRAMDDADTISTCHTLITCAKDIAYRLRMRI